jgi:DNA-binding NarL/FixJ family response regulator
MTSALRYMETEPISVLVTDIMMPAGDEFPSVDSAETGFVFVAKVRRKFPKTSVICLSVIGDQKKINELKRTSVLYLRKGETPLSTAASLIESKATGRYTA